MKQILSFKHWQLFLLIVILGAWTSPSPLKEIINSIAMLTFTIWIYSIGVNGQTIVSEMKMKNLNIKLFKTNIYLIPFLYILFLFIAPPDTPEEPEFNLQLLLEMIVGLYVLFAMLQTIIFACKTIATIELKREVTLGDYFVNLLLVFFLIIGIWILQPKVTRLIADNELTPKE